MGDVLLPLVTTLLLSLVHAPAAHAERWTPPLAGRAVVREFDFDARLPFVRGPTGGRAPGRGAGRGRARPVQRARDVLRASPAARAGAHAALRRARGDGVRPRAPARAPRRRARRGNADRQARRAGTLHLGARRARDRWGYRDPLALLATGGARRRRAGPAPPPAGPRRPPAPPAARAAPRAAPRAARGLGRAGRGRGRRGRGRAAAPPRHADAAPGGGSPRGERPADPLAFGRHGPLLVLRHHADLLRQRGAPSRARLHDHRRGRAGPPPPPARAGRLLPDGDRRARRARDARRRARGRDAGELADRNYERFQALRRSSARRTTSSSARATRGTSPRSSTSDAGEGQRLRVQGPVRGLVLPQLRGLQDRARDRRGQHLPDPQDPADREHEQSWFFRLSAFQEPLERLFAERPDFVQPRVRYNEALSFIKSGLQDVALSPEELDWGVPVPWDPRTSSTSGWTRC